MLRAAFVVFLLLGAFVSFAQTRAIKPGDKLKITCAEEPGVDKLAEVSRDGVVLVNFLGAVVVNGLTEQEAADRIRDQLVKDRIVRKATVAVQVVSSVALVRTDPIQFVGAVADAPASLPYTVGQTLGLALAKIELEKGADLARVQVKKLDGTIINLDANRADGRAVALDPGDIVTIPRGETPVDQTPTHSVPDPKANPLPGEVPTKPIEQAQPDPSPAEQPEPEAEAEEGAAVSPQSLIFVTGGVRAPGPIIFRPGLTLREAIEEAGGLAVTGELPMVTIERDGRVAETIDMSLPNTDAPLTPDDRIVVPMREPRAYVEVKGAVRKPGYLVLQPGMMLSQAIRAAGGLSTKARPDRVQIISATEGEKPRTVNFAEIQQGYMGDIPLKPGEQVVVAGPPTRNGTPLAIIAGAGVLWYVIGR
ncbi:MAG: SLBB domain-containing protein [Fimbriimonadaceae bacterium]|nr:SLBB domain-containing protein [Fimbriimonadaceae bacterium]QYK54822.1 MAG: SLBB domain-containing protein [Fimbriimonadaceae bacterium]